MAVVCHTTLRLLVHVQWSWSPTFFFVVFFSWVAMPVSLPCLDVLLILGVALCVVSHDTDTASSTMSWSPTHFFCLDFFRRVHACLTSLSGRSPGACAVLIAVSRDADTASSTWSSPTHVFFRLDYFLCSDAR